MRNAHPKYLCFPSVVCVGKETQVYITPRDINYYFRDDQNYALAVLGLGQDQFSYHSPLSFDHPWEVKDGCLLFSHYFDAEQEYSVQIRDAAGKVHRISLYAVEEDLYELRPLKGDLHSHSAYSDGSDGMAMTPADYREEGYDFFALTDHNRMYPSQMLNQLYADIPLGMHMMIGEEIHTPGSLLHIVHVGGAESVCNKYIHNRDAYEAAVDQISQTLTHIPELYRRRMAMAVWACKEIHNAGGLAILAHPCWCPRRYNVTREFADLLFQEKIFDAFELMGGDHDKTNNLQLALWIEHLLMGSGLPVVGSTDSHNHDVAEDKSFAKRFTLVFAKENTTEAILDAIRAGYSVSAEVTARDDTNVRFYSTKMRLVLFAHFLYKNYFNETWRLCVGEGILMRRYAQGEDVASLLAALAPTVESFYKRFYGITPPEGMPENRLKFLQECLARHKSEGPGTKGSSLELQHDGKNKRQD